MLKKKPLKERRLYQDPRGAGPSEQHQAVGKSSFSGSEAGLE